MPLGGTVSHKDEDLSVFEIPSVVLTLSYLAYSTGAGLFLVVLSYFWGDNLLMSFADISEGDISLNGVTEAWFIFAWALGATIVLVAIQGLSYAYDSRLIRLVKGWWASLNAGVFEELIFRWLLFFSAMITLPFFNYITFGLVKLLYVEVLIPVANFTTLGALDAQLTGGSWVLGAAIISVNAEFRDGHRGFIGKINSWFIGMIMFYLVFNYNIQTAIAAHVLYDIIAFSIEAVMVKGTARRLGRFGPVL